MTIQNAIQPTTYRPFTVFNPRVKTRVFSTKPVGYETLIVDTFRKPLTYPFIAGVLDGDGFIRTYKYTGEYEITMHLEDQPFLEQFKQQFGGYIQKVLDKNSMRLHINAKTAINGKNTLIDLTNGLNGHIRNTVRTEQFKQVCNALGIEYLTPKPITLEDGYIAGLFVTDGTIFINCRPSAVTRAATKLDQSNIKNKKQLKFTDSGALENRIQRVLKGVAPLIEIKIFNKYILNVEQVAKAFGFGNTYFAKGTPRLPAFTSQGGHYFYIKKEEQILKFVEYMALNRSSSIKHKRLNLVKEFYRLKAAKAHLPNAKAFEKAAFEKLIRQWFLVTDSLCIQPPCEE